MYRKEEILQKLNEDNYYIDLKALDSFINEWSIEAIYESKDGTNFYDDTSIAKIKKGISLKSQGYNKEQISYRLEKTPFDTRENTSVTEIQKNEPEKSAPEMKNVTLNVTNQTLQMIAEAVASKITDDIKNHIECAEFADKLVESGTYKKDNEFLSKQVESLIEDNKKMAKRINELEKKAKPFWKKIFD